MKIKAGDNCIIDRCYLQKEKTFRYVSYEYQNSFINLMGKTFEIR